MIQAQQSVNAQPEWQVTAGLADYILAAADQDERAKAIADGLAPERLWLLEHPPLITAGTSTRHGDLLDPERFPLFTSPRGGQLTYHGPGQRIVYIQLDLSRRGKDIRRFVCAAENWIIAALADLGVRGVRREGRVGVWVEHPQKGESKIAALGVRVRRWITLHGVSINVDPDLDAYDAIIPCGIREHGITSLRDLGLDCTMAEVDSRLLAHRDRFLSSLD